MFVYSYVRLFIVDFFLCLRNYMSLTDIMHEVFVPDVFMN
jgi:hypothetical protein